MNITNLGGIPEALASGEKLTPIVESLKWMENFWWVILLLLIWTLTWKGLALWRAAQNGSKPWFIILLLVNTVGILDLIYVLGFSKKKSWLKKIAGRL